MLYDLARPSMYISLVEKGQWVDKAMHRVAAKEREEVERTTKQKMAR